MAIVQLDAWPPTQCTDCALHGVSQWRCADSGHVDGQELEYVVRVRSSVQIQDTWLSLRGERLYAAVTYDDDLVQLIS